MSTGTAIDSTALRDDVTPGSVSDDVAAVQARLIELGFDPGPVDGYHGDATLRAIWAYQKLVAGIDRTEITGVVTPSDWEQMRTITPPRPRRSTKAQANHTEIYLPEQVIAIFHRDRPVLISHMSSGALDQNGQPAEWCEVVTIDTDERGNPLFDYPNPNSTTTSTSTSTSVPDAVTTTTVPNTTSTSPARPTDPTTATATTTSAGAAVDAG